MNMKAWHCEIQRKRGMAGLLKRGLALVLGLALALGLGMQTVAFATGTDAGKEKAGEKPYSPKAQEIVEQLRFYGENRLSKMTRDQKIDVIRGLAGRFTAEELEEALKEGGVPKWAEEILRSGEHLQPSPTDRERLTRLKTNGDATGLAQGWAAGYSTNYYRDPQQQKIKSMFGSEMGRELATFLDLILVFYQARKSI